MRWLLHLVLLTCAAAAAQPELTVWTYFRSDADDRWLREQAQAYGEREGVTVTVRTFGFDDLRARLRLPAAGSPDLVVTVPHDWLPALLEAGALAPLDGIVDPAAFSGIMPLALDAFSANGTLFGWPLEIGGVALIHDRAQLAQAPTTWEAFVALAQSATGDGRFGFLYPFAEPFFSYGWWHAYGGYIFAPTTGGGWDDDDLGLAGEPGYAAARLLRDLRHDLGLLPAHADYAFADGEFLAGRTPMIINGAWALAEYRHAGIDVGVAPVPTPPGAVQPWGPLVGVQGIGIGARTADPVAAANLAAFLAGPEAARAYRDAGGIRIPAHDGGGQLEEDPLAVAFAAVLAGGAVMPATSAIDGVWAPWTSAMRLATATDDADVESIIDDLETRLKR